MTECGPIICHSPWHETAYMSCGRAAEGMELKVLSSDPARIPGELVCRGRNTMLGYYKNQEATEQIFDADGWLHTGDMAVINPEGRVHQRTLQEHAAQCKRTKHLSGRNRITVEQPSLRQRIIGYHVQ